MKRGLLRLCGAILVAVILTCTLPGCGSNTIKVNIKDAFTETRLSISAGRTVGDALSEAEIELGDKDYVTPEKSETLNGDCTINILRHTTSTVTCDGKTTEVVLTGATVKDALKKAGVEISDNDYINYDSSAYVSDGMRIVVVRRLSVKLIDNGKTETFLTEAKTVRGFLKKQGIKIGKDDIITPKRSKKLGANTTIVIKRVTYKTVTENQVIKHATKYEESSSVAAGTSVTKVKGKNGQKKVMYRIKYIDGKQSSKKKIKEEIIKEAVDEIITRGATATQPATQKATNSKGKTEVSRQRVDDCNGSGHGYFIIKYSDGSESYKEY